MTTHFLKQGFYEKPVGIWGPNPNRNPNYGGPWLWRPLAMAGHHRRHRLCFSQQVFLMSFPRVLTSMTINDLKAQKRFLVNFFVIFRLWRKFEE